MIFHHIHPVISEGLRYSSGLVRTSRWFFPESAELCRQGIEIPVPDDPEGVFSLSFSPARDGSVILFAVFCPNICYGRRSAFLWDRLILSGCQLSMWCVCQWPRAGRCKHWRQSECQSPCVPIKNRYVGNLLEPAVTAVTPAIFWPVFLPWNYAFVRLRWNPASAVPDSAHQ